MCGKTLKIDASVLIVPEFGYVAVKSVIWFGGKAKNQLESKGAA